MTESKKIIPHPRHYWGLLHGDQTVMTGTFSDCWENLVDSYGHTTLKTLEQLKIRIARIK